MRGCGHLHSCKIDLDYLVERMAACKRIKRLGEELLANPVAKANNVESLLGAITATGDLVPIFVRVALTRYTCTSQTMLCEIAFSYGGPARTGDVFLRRPAQVRIAAGQNAAGWGY